MPNLFHKAIDDGAATSTAIAIDPKGRIYVGYGNVGNRKGDVVVFSPDGKQIGPTIKVPDGVSGLVLR
jgi:sugar lactone lactonase YvrE